MGSCQYKDATWMCDDTSIRFLFLEGTCTIQLVAEEWHEGLWTCHASPYHTRYTDQVQVVITPHGRKQIDEVWWKEGWRAALLWSSIAVILIIIIAIFLVCLCRLCPSLTCCGWKTDNKEPRRRSRDNEVQGWQEEEDDSTYQRINIPGVDRISLPISDTYSNIVDTDNDTAGAFTIEYSDPQHYDRGQTRTARKLTNLDTGMLEERIRKASGIATNEHLI